MPNLPSSKRLASAQNDLGTRATNHCYGTLATACLAAGFLLAGCFEPPVEERLELRFVPGAAVEIELTIEHTFPFIVDGENPKVQRLAEEERMLLDGWSPWQRRFEALEMPSVDGLQWEKEDGRLQRYRRWATLHDPEGLTDFFADTLVHAFYQEGDGWAELSLHPGSGSRATAEEIRSIDATLDDWSAVVADYLDAAIELWSYNERRPRRAFATLAPIFSDFVDESVTLPELSAHEEKLVSRLVDAMDEVTWVFEVPDDEVRTVEEISRLVYDPFPARLTVEVAGPILEVEGFVAGTEGTLGIPGLSFWSSLVALEGLWLTPDPLVALVTHLRQQEDSPFDLEEYLGRQFAAEDPPDEREVRIALDELLEPQDVYRVAWEQ